jgi:Holliday junction resolvasome RuvABC DNA-binding subunit
LLVVTHFANGRRFTMRRPLIVPLAVLLLTSVAMPLAAQPPREPLAVRGQIGENAKLDPKQPPAEPQDAAKVNALIQKLQSPKVGERFEALKALKALGPKAAQAIPALTKVAQGDPDEDLRKLAGACLAGLQSPLQDPQTAASLKGLIAKLESTSAGERFAAVKALKQLGPNAQPAVPALTHVALNDPDDDIRQAAKECLKAIAAKEFPLVGTWLGTSKLGDIVTTYEFNAKADGNFQTIQTMQGFGVQTVLVVRGTYAYSEGVLTWSGKVIGGIVDGLPVNGVSTVSWINQNQFTSTGDGMQITYQRKK